MDCNNSSLGQIYLVTAFQGSPHYRDIPDALKTIIDTTIRKINKDLLYRFVMVLGVHKFSHSKLLCCKSKFSR